MITRKLNELQINNVLEHINNQSLATLSIYKNNRGQQMISYHTYAPSISSTPKSYTTVELIRIMREIRRQVCNNSYDTIKLDYDSVKQTLSYQLELKEQG